jgi:hypothetical protein
MRFACVRAYVRAIRTTYVRTCTYVRDACDAYVHAYVQVHAAYICVMRTCVVSMHHACVQRCVYVPTLTYVRVMVARAYGAWVRTCDAYVRDTIRDAQEVQCVR